MRNAFQVTTRLALIVVLLSGWHAGLLHPLKHTDETGRLVHLAGKHLGGDKKPSPAPADKLCDALAGLAICLSGAPLAALEFHGTELAVYEAFQEPHPSGWPPFLAQGPPDLL